MPRFAGFLSRPVNILCGCFLLSTSLWIGCTGSTSNGPSAEGAKLLMVAEPADPMGVMELKSSMITGIAPMDDSTAIVGRIASGQDWETDQAMFLIRDLQAESAHDHGDGGDHSDCAFCKAKEKETGSMALVRVVDAEGKTIGSDARKLLGLAEEQVIVAQGVGTIDEDGTLVFAASKIFIRK